MVRVWRLEHPDTGEGPFVARYSPWDLAATMEDDDGPRRMPAPGGYLYGGVPAIRGDARQKHHRGWVFAFSTLTSLRRWITRRWLQMAQDGGFVLRAYAVPWDAHALLPDQVIFDREAALVVREVHPVEAVSSTLGPSLGRPCPNVITKTRRVKASRTTAQAKDVPL